MKDCDNSKIHISNNFIMNDKLGNVWIGRIYLKPSTSKSRKQRKHVGMIYGQETQIIKVFYTILLRNQCHS
jgi:hypothetical protein